MTKSLTWQWKNGELKKGKYFYIKTEGYPYNVTIITKKWLEKNRHKEHTKIVDVLDKVPTYREYSLMKEANEYMGKQHNYLIEKIEQLKEQIKMVEWKGKVK